MYHVNKRIQPQSFNVPSLLTDPQLYWKTLQQSKQAITEYSNQFSLLVAVNITYTTQNYITFSLMIATNTM